MGRWRRSELVQKGGTNHVTWRTHNLERYFEEPGARSRFLELMAKHKDKYGMKVRSYCVMGSHPHAVVSNEKGQKAFSNFWKVVNQSFARWFNKLTGRRGQVVMERLASPQIQGERHQLLAMRYGDMNPVRAGLVKSPKDWPWSSYRHYAFGEPNPLIDDAPEYLALGFHPAIRRKAYQALFDYAPSAEEVARARRDLVRGPFIGDPEWIEERLRALATGPPEKKG